MPDYQIAYTLGEQTKAIEKQTKVLERIAVALEKLAESDKL